MQRQIRDYLRALQRECESARSGGVQSLELAVRPVVHGFLQELVAAACPTVLRSRIRILHDATIQPGDRPDWRIEDSLHFGLYAIGDHKAPCVDGPFRLTAPQKRQLSRYCAYKRPTFVFDGIEFVFLNSDTADDSRHCLVPKPLRWNSDWGTGEISLGALEHFRRLFDQPGFSRWTESDLMEQLAIQASGLREELRRLLVAPLDGGESLEENVVIAELHALKSVIEKHHDPSLRSVGACAAFLAQLIAFSAYYAHLDGQSASSPAESLRAIRAFWQSDGTEGLSGEMRPFGAIRRVVAAALAAQDGGLCRQLRSLSELLAHARYCGLEQGPTDFHALFERFLARFDPDERFDRGVFFTPQLLAEWTARFVDTLSIKHFGRRLGEVARKAIDPCCGTGGFLEALLDAGVLDEVGKTRLVGIEVLPVPYALCQYRFAKRGRLTQSARACRVLLTDTLSDQLTEELCDAGSLFAGEQAEAQVLIEPPVTLVIGNPPSSQSSASVAPRDRINKQLVDFRPPVEERAARQNTQKAVNNEAYRFLRWACDRVLRTERGIVALILPGAFARQISLRWARRWLAANFSHVYVLELDEDRRSGQQTDSLFSVMQGRCLVVAVHGGRGDKASEAQIRCLDLARAPLAKKHDFLKQDPSLEAFASIELVKPGFAFARRAVDMKSWTASVPLGGGERAAFSTACSGVKLAPTHLLFHVEPSRLQTRLREVADANGDTQRLDAVRTRWYSRGTKAPRFSEFSPEVWKELARMARNPASAVVRYSYRPFLPGWIIDSEELFRSLGQSGGGGTRSRPEVRRAFATGAIGIAVAADPSLLSRDVQRFAAFAWHLPDNDLVARGSARIVCDRAAVTGSDSLRSNVSVQLAEYFEGLETPARTALFYSYAILSSSAYLSHFASSLAAIGSNGEWPRVPIFTSPELRGRIASIGQQIADCEHAEGPVEGELDLPSECSELEVQSWSADVDERCISLASDSQRVVIREVPSETLALRIAGHEVLKQRLKWTEYSSLRRRVNQSDLESLRRAIGAMSRQCSLLREIDSIVRPELDRTDSLVDLGME